MKYRPIYTCDAVRICIDLYRTTDINFYVYILWYFKYIARGMLNTIIHVSVSLFDINTHVWLRLFGTVNVLCSTSCNANLLAVLQFELIDVF